MARGSSVQTIYELCKKTFSSSSPSSQSISKLAALMDGITPAEVGLEEEMLDDERGHGFLAPELLVGSARLARWARPITYLHVYECERFSIGIFCLPTSSCIPLHDHPGMTVLSKILYGSVHVKSYDWVEPARPESFPVRLAKLHADRILTAASGTSVLHPDTGGNLHCFTAVSPCAIFDVLVPPYDVKSGRTCSYYQDYPYSSFSELRDRAWFEESEGTYGWLRAVEQPEDLYMQPGRYAGPAVQVA